LPEEVRRDMTFVPVKMIEEVLRLALPPEDAPPPIAQGDAAPAEAAEAAQAPAAPEPAPKPDVPDAEPVPAAGPTASEA
jgi:hypothetical protein